MTRFKLVSVIIASAALLCLVTPSSRAQEAGTRTPSAWSREEAIRQLQLYPRDPYLQFVVMQLSKTASEQAEAGHYLPRSETERQVWQRRNEQVDLYSIFSGSLAVQESLQLDAMTGRTTQDADVPTIDIKKLPGPTVQSHPWHELLAGRSPQVSRLAECVPNDHLFIRFRSVSKLMGMRKLLDETYLYASGNLRGNTRSAGVMDRLQQQWLTPTNDLLRPLYDAAISELAITSSDLFFYEGTDATLIMRLNQPQLIRPQLYQMLASAAAEHPGLAWTDGTINGIKFRHAKTADGTVDVYVADPTDDLHVRSNSKVALERILHTIVGPTAPGSTSKSLAQSDEFRYIRTLMPLGAEEEDGFVYLSDPFIRNLIGAEKKLTQRNRLLCRCELQMLDYAQLLYRTQYGKVADSIEELRRHSCLGTSDQPITLTCPDGGHLHIDPTNSQSYCSHHGPLHSMHPTAEIPVTHATAAQAREYEQFVTNYSRYWQTFFDPIAVRIQSQPKKTRVETIVLPLINNSIYRGLAATLGGKPEPLDELPVPQRNIFSLAFRLDKSRLLEQVGIANPRPQDKPPEEPDSRPEWLVIESERNLLQTGLAIHNFHSAYRQLPPRPTSNGPQGLSWRVHLLPFLEEQALYERFHLDEPWDSEHNLPLIKEIPDVYAATAPDLARDGMTRIVFPQNPAAAYVGPDQTMKFRDMLDGLSNTILAVVADSDHAVVWTKPDDLPVDLSMPRQGWSEGVDETVSVLFGDGAVRRIPPDVSDEVVGHLLTRRGKEVIEIDLPVSRARPGSSSRNRSFLSDFAGLPAEVGIDELLHHGIGNQIAIHVCDDDPLLDLNLSRFAGLMTGMRGSLSMETVGIGLMVAAFNSPVYVSVPVEDPEVVDRVLDRLDRVLAEKSRQGSSSLGGFIRLETDFYRREASLDPAVRTHAIRFGPVTWRFYWARIGQGLFIASKPDLIEELKSAAQQAGTSRSPSKQSDAGHALVRVRPTHWNQVKPHFRIGWAEAERCACHDCQGTLTNALRAVRGTNPDGAPKELMSDAIELSSRLFQHRVHCLTDGDYVIAEDGTSVSCTVHGSVREPRQPETPGRVAEFAESLQDVRMDLTFLEDGLHAVVTLESK